MKIAIFGPSKRFLSGISYYTIRLSNALSRHAEVKTILFRKMLPKRLFPGWKRVGEELTKLEYSDKVEVQEILDWNNPLSWRKAYKIAEDCDAMIFQWWTSSVAHMYLAIELMNRRKIPIVLEFHEVLDPLEKAIFPIRIYSTLIGRLVRKFATCFVVHSQSDKELISKAYGIPKNKISVIPHGLYDHYERVENAKELLDLEENFVILFFGLLRPYKGAKLLIKAFEMLPEEIVNNSTLLIVGEVWEDKEAVELARKSKFKERIKVVDRYIPDEEVSLYFSASDVLVLPYLRASQSGVAHIGMTFGLPIIATKVGGLTEALFDYPGTYFVEPNPESIAEALQRIYTNKGKKFEAPKRLKWENLAQEWIHLIDSLNRKA